MRMLTLKQAAEAIGLSQWELRQGVKTKKIPYYRAGDPEKGKILFDLAILETHVQKIMDENINSHKLGQHGQLRRIGN